MPRSAIWFALLARHEVPVVEDDVYEELYQGDKAPASAKHFDRRGLVMHCRPSASAWLPGTALAGLPRAGSRRRWSVSS
jgi:DNA-binding transcriptional MocR family regulator